MRVPVTSFSPMGEYKSQRRWIRFRLDLGRVDLGIIHEWNFWNEAYCSCWLCGREQTDYQSPTPTGVRLVVGDLLLWGLCNPRM